MRETIRSFDGKSLSVAVWQKVAKPKAILQIFHGMAEHIGRYDDFAKFMNKKGIIIVGADQRSHGVTDKDSLGVATEKNLFEDTVKDQLYLTEVYSGRFDLPVIILGHSYGSFLAQRYIQLQTQEKIKGYIFSGSALMEGIMLNFGSFVANRKFKKHRDDKARFLYRQTFKKYDKKFGEGLSGWLSRDLAETGKYNIDDLCGFVVSYGFYKWFFQGIKTANSEPLMFDKNIKMLIASGSEDMVGGRGKLTKKLYSKYKDYGANPTLKLYEGARHEILNELNKKEVYNDFADFVASCIKEE